MAKLEIRLENLGLEDGLIKATFMLLAEALTLMSVFRCSLSLLISLPRYGREISEDKNIDVYGNRWSKGHACGMS